MSDFLISRLKSHLSQKRVKSRLTEVVVNFHPVVVAGKIAIVCSVIVPICASAVSVLAGDRSYGNVQVSAIRSVYDGDTFRADIAGWPPIIGEWIPVRVAGINAPEIKGKCVRERMLAVMARDAARAMLLDGSRVELFNLRRGKYFRIVADVWIDEKSLAKALIAQGLARSYDGGTKQSWC